MRRLCLIDSRLLRGKMLGGLFVGGVRLGLTLFGWRFGARFSRGRLVTGSRGQRSRCRFLFVVLAGGQVREDAQYRVANLVGLLDMRMCKARHTSLVDTYFLKKTNEHNNQRNTHSIDRYPSEYIRETCNSRLSFRVLLKSLIVFQHIL